ncbi:MAG: phosphoribosylaminoimidazolesuccinocarboxamide synthase [Bradymonadaceae bacterium]|nr:phosphoribosylaminoimidazolesuccinocarboxamide synthase [Lujinxingiaceae bacterium]
MRNEQIYEGKAKKLLLTDDKNVLLQRFKDSATAFNGVKKAEFAGKGETNNAISTFCFQKLEAAGVPTHFIERVNDRDMLIKRLDMIPLEIVVRNIVAGSLAKRTGLDEGTVVKEPIVETYLKRDDLNDPHLADVHVFMLDILRPDQLERLKQLALKVNATLDPIFERAGMKLVDFKLEFGLDADGQVVLGDEFSPDTSRLWDLETRRKLDKDVFRADLGDLMEVYHEVAARLGVLPQT